MRVEGRGGPGALAARQLSAQHAADEPEGTVGVVVLDQPGLLHDLAGGTVAPRVHRGGVPGGQLTTHPADVAGGAGEPGARARVDGAQVVPLGTQGRLEVVDRGRERPEGQLGGVLDEVDRPAEAQQHGVAVGRGQLRVGAQRVAEPADVGDLLGPGRHAHERLGEVEPGDELLRERPGRLGVAQGRLVPLDALGAGRGGVGRQGQPGEGLGHLVPLAHAGLPLVRGAPLCAYRLGRRSTSRRAWARIVTQSTFHRGLARWESGSATTPRGGGR